MLNKANLAKVRRRESSGPSETLIRPEELSAFSLPQDAAKLSKLILKKIGGGGGLAPALFKPELFRVMPLPCKA